MTPSGKRNYRVACLAGHGVGPEVMAEASRAVAAVSRHHGFSVEETHVPFGGEALSRSGHHLPVATRAAYLTADAVLVAASDEPALAGVVAELDLGARVTRVRAAGQVDVSVLAPLADDAAEWAVERAFETAVAGSARLVSVASDSGWRSLVERVSARYDGVLVEHLGVADAVPRLAFDAESVDVAVTSTALGEALAGVVASGEREHRVVAHGFLGQGPGVFSPGGDVASEEAGQGVANPCSMLLAASLMLDEGLHEPSAAATLAEAVAGAVADGVCTPDMVASGVAGTTREFTDALLAELPRRVTNFEFYRRAYA
jgi:isocitrate/isopropylmalate dehydrogenase